MSAGAGNDLIPIDDHCRLTGQDDTSFSRGCGCSPGPFPGGRLRRKKRHAGTVWLAFELDRGDCAFPLIATPLDAGSWLQAARRYA
jgi:hypothetical protein